MSVSERGECLLEILSLTIRKELLSEYRLDLSEIYTLLDYSDVLKQDAAKLRTELKNFLAAFDEYFKLTGEYPMPGPVLDAEQAMFSAANQARKVLE